MTYLDTLKKLALAATPGPWEMEDKKYPMQVVVKDPKFEYLLICACAVNTRRDEGRHNVDYIAACSPERILAMLAVIEAAKALDHRSTRETSIALHAALVKLK